MTKSCIFVRTILNVLYLLSPSIFLSISLSLSLIFFSLSLSIYLFISISLSLFLSISLCLFLYLSLILPLSLSLWLIYFRIQCTKWPLWCLKNKFYSVIFISSSGVEGAEACFDSVYEMLQQYTRVKEMCPSRLQNIKSYTRGWRQQEHPPPLHTFFFRS